MSFLSWTTVALMSAGVFFFFTATLGLLRFPDFYTRMHATGKGDTLGALLLLAGMAVYNLDHGFSLAALFVSIKVLFIALFIFVANPTACHAVTKAALDAGIEPWTREQGGQK